MKYNESNSWKKEEYLYNKSNDGAENVFRSTYSIESAFETTEHVR